MKAISIHNLSFAYQDVTVLSNVTFQIAQGEFVAVIGPNGGGKTTLLQLIMGFLKPSQGSIEVFGKPPHLSLMDVAYVPQKGHFDKQFPISVLEVVLMGRLRSLPWYGRYRKEDLAQAEEVLNKLGLIEIKNRPFGTLSGGQAQRTLIARALFSEPKLLLLDEPTANVDAKTQSEIYELLKQLSGEMTIVMVTHDLNAAIHGVEKVLCVQRDVLTLKPEEVCEHFAIGLYHSTLIKPNRSKT